MKIVILGYGNVAQHLVRAFMNNVSTDLVQVYNRTPITESLGVECITDISKLAIADVYIIALPDDVIANFSEKLPFTNRMVVHTSGSVQMTQLSTNNRSGVFYPLQTFSKDRSVEFETVPICVEASTTSDLQTLRTLGKTISAKVVAINSDQRKLLHLAAVFVNNFTNHLYGISERMVVDNQLSFDLLKPLILETAKKMESLSPTEAQTGPAKRKDTNTIEKHLEQLTDAQQNGTLDGSTTELYTLFTRSILNTYHGKKL